jgi:tRNA uridine 5-carbamoylmethylation protein Kti12
LEITRKESQVIIIDPDRIRNNLFPELFNYKKEKIVRKKNLKEVQKALKKGLIVISDDLNYYTSMRHDLKRIADNYKLSFYIIHISTPLEQCIIWNKKRGEPIPNELIQNIDKKFDPFHSYAWDKPYISLNLLEITNLDEKIRKLLELIEQDKKLRAEEVIKTNSQRIKNRANQKLDQITRKIVALYLKDLSDKRLITKILSLRKEFIKNNMDKHMRNSEIKKKFTSFLKTQLKEV